VALFLIGASEQRSTHRHESVSYSVAGARLCRAARDAAAAAILLKPSTYSSLTLSAQYTHARPSGGPSCCAP
jgi:hypothetical protein